MKICNCALPYVSGPDVCKDCGNNNEYPEMIDKVSPPLYGNSTTVINIDYYNELKAKADKWDEKETQYKPTGVEPFGLTKMGFCKCGKAVVENENYCVHCGNKLDWDSEGYRDWETDRKSTRLNSSHSAKSRMPSSA